MGVTMLPGAPQYGQGGSGGVDVGQLGQLMLAVKQYKMQEAETKRQHAQQKVQVLMQNPAILTATDPKDVEKALKDAYDLKFSEGSDAPVNPNAKPEVNPAASPGGGAKVDPSKIAAVGNAVQGNKSGAQAGSPASPNAANKAPGGGVEKVGNAQVTEQMAADARQVQGDKMGHLAGLYSSAVDAQVLAHHKAQSEIEIEQLKSQAAQGDPRAMGRLSQLAGKQVTDADLRAMIATGSNNPELVSKALDVALGNETDSDKAKRFDNTLKTLTQSADVMGKLQNPLDVSNVARSIVYGGGLPEGVRYKPFSMDELKQEADYEKVLIQDQGLPYEIAHLVSRGRTMGIPPSQSVPPAFQGLLTGKSLSERKVKATEVQAGAAALSSKAEMIKAEAELVKVGDAHSKIERMTTLDENKALTDRLKEMTEADKAKHPWPDAIKTALLDEVATRAGLTPMDAQSWYEHITGGTHREYKAKADSGLATGAAGTKPGETPKTPSKTVAERGGLVHTVKEGLRSAGVPNINTPEGRKRLGEIPGELEDKPMQWIRDIIYGTEKK